LVTHGDFQATSFAGIPRHPELHRRACSPSAHVPLCAQWLKWFHIRLFFIPFFLIPSPFIALPTSLTQHFTPTVPCMRMVKKPKNPKNKYNIVAHKFSNSKCIEKHDMQIIYSIANRLLYWKMPHTNMLVYFSCFKSLLVT
jgi:hypothetical protein